MDWFLCSTSVADHANAAPSICRSTTRSNDILLPVWLPMHGGEWEFPISRTLQTCFTSSRHGCYFQIVHILLLNICINPSHAIHSPLKNQGIEHAIWACVWYPEILSCNPFLFLPFLQGDQAEYVVHFTLKTTLGGRLGWECVIGPRVYSELHGG